MSFKNHRVTINNFSTFKAVNFLEYVFGGCDIALSIAIDYTASNGDANQPSSLHYMGRNMNNI